MSTNSQLETLASSQSVLGSYICFKKEDCKSSCYVHKDDYAYLSLNGKIINFKKGYEGPPPIRIVIRSRDTFYKFMDKLYQVTGYEKQYTRLAVLCRYRSGRST